MPTLTYTPRESAGIFDFPLIGVIRYLEEILREYQWSPYRYTLRNLVELSKRNRDVIEINEYPILNLGDFDAANLIDRGRFSVYCPVCRSTFWASQTQRENWSYHRGMRFAGGGRCYSCTLGHVLLNTQDWMA
jgi:hypothetical protein